MDGRENIRDVPKFRLVIKNFMEEEEELSSRGFILSIKAENWINEYDDPESN